MEELLPRVYEFSELLVDKLGSHRHRCLLSAHASHSTLPAIRCEALNIGDRPVRLLRSVRGLTYIELPQHDQCCGFGGTFAIKNANVSAAMLCDKIAASWRPEAEVCTAGDNSCLMHIGGGLSRQRRAGPLPAPRGDSGIHGGRTRMSVKVGQAAEAPSFAGGRAGTARQHPASPERRHATDVIRAKRAKVVAETPDWQELRDSARADQGPRAAPSGRLPGAVRSGLHRSRRQGALGARCGRGQRHRHRHHPGARRNRSHQGQDHDLR